jgi:hypothetical protein
MGTIDNNTKVHKNSRSSHQIWKDSNVHTRIMQNCGMFRSLHLDFFLSFCKEMYVNYITSCSMRYHHHQQQQQLGAQMDVTSISLGRNQWVSSCTLLLCMLLPEVHKVVNTLVCNVTLWRPGFCVYFCLNNPSCKSVPWSFIQSETVGIKKILLNVSLS